MGVDTSFAQFLLGARASGVSFAKCATIGRQEFFPKEEILAAMLPKFGIDLSAKKLASECNGYAEPFLKLLGAETISAIDASAYEGAEIICDLNEPIPENFKHQFSVVIDGGSIEHIFNISQALKNMMELVAPGGHFLGMTCANNMNGHGFYQLSPEWAFRAFTPENGFEIETVMIVEPNAPKLKFYSVDDPYMLNRRTKLVNHEPAILLVLAKKISIEPVFSTTPQQSDYMVQWRRVVPQNQTPTKPVVPLAKRIKRIPRQILFSCALPIARRLPERTKDKLLKRWQKGSRSLARDFKRDCYHLITIEDMARGQLSHESTVQAR